MEQREFCDRVLSRVRHATPEEKDAIRAEMEGHMEDHAAALEAAGYAPDAAIARAAEAMGNPEEIGAELDRQYPLIWLVLSRAALVLSILTVLFLTLNLPAAGNLWESVQARVNPEKGLRSGQVLGTYLYSLDLQADVGNDVLRVFQVGITPSGDGENASVSLGMCNYDQSLFGDASQTLLNYVTYETADRELRPAGGGGGGSSGVYYWVAKDIEVSRTDPYIAVCYDRFGVSARLEVPLDWEGA